MSKGGRPSKYKVEYNEQARKLCLLGYTDIQLAHHFAIAESTLNKWKKEKPEFSESLRQGKCDADGEVVESLFKEAKTGNVTACIFWLKNRQGRAWRDKPEETEIVVNEEISEEFL